MIDTLHSSNAPLQRRSFLVRTLFADAWVTGTDVFDADDELSNVEAFSGVTEVEEDGIADDLDDYGIASEAKALLRLDKLSFCCR